VNVKIALKSILAHLQKRYMMIMTPYVLVVNIAHLNVPWIFNHPPLSKGENK
jgi:hypothetical protein